MTIFIEFKDLPHGTYRDFTPKLASRGAPSGMDNPGETIQIDPAGTVTRIPLTSSQVAETV